MAKVATVQTISSIDLARALAAKKTPGYINAKKWGIYSYEDVIYPQARLAFPLYNRLYDTNEAFNDYFVRDLNKKDSQLVKILGDKTVEKILIGDTAVKPGQVSAAEVSEQTTAQAAAETAPPAAGAPPTGGGPGPGGFYPGALGGGGGYGSSRVTVDEKGRVASNTPQTKTIETGLDYEGKPYAAEEPPSTMASKKEVSEHKPATSKSTRTFQAPKIPTALSSAGKNFTSKLGIFFKRNSVGALSGIFAGVGGFIGQRITGAPGLLFGAVGAGSLPSLVKSGIINLQPGGIISRIGRGASGVMGRVSTLTGPKLGGISKLKGFGTGRKIALAFTLFGLLFGFSLISAVFSPNQTTPTASASNLLDYTIPFRDTTVTPTDIKDEVKASWPNAKLENWDTIIQKSVAAGWNPAFVLALWIEETGAQGKASYSDPLGCSPGQPTTDIDLSLSCLFNNFSNFTSNQFTQFMLRYSEGLSGTTFTRNPNFPNGIKSWYARLVPSGPGALTFVPTSTAYTPNGGSGIISCPLNGVATYTLGSKDAGGHCTPQYQAQEAPCLSGDPTGRSSAIDVQSADSADKAVFLPMLGGQKADWRVDVSGPVNDSGVYVGDDLAATASYNGKSYRIRFVHLEPTSLTIGQHYPSGTKVGNYRTTQNHVHITIQEDGVFKPADLYFNLCK